MMIHHLLTIYYHQSDQSIVKKIYNKRKIQNDYIWNPFKPEITIKIFIHYELRIFGTILVL